MLAGMPAEILSRQDMTGALGNQVLIVGLNFRFFLGFMTLSSLSQFQQKDQNEQSGGLALSIQANRG
jgi:hypothetical protein